MFKSLGLSLFYLLLGCVLFTSAQARQAIIEDHLDSAQLGQDILYLEDPAGTLDLESALATTEGWQQNDDPVFNKGYSKSAWWLRVDLANQSHQTEKLLEISYAVLDHLDIYVLREGVLVKQYNLGDKVTFSHRPIDHRYFVVPIDLQQEVPTSILLRVRTSSSMQVPLTLWDKTSFDRQNTRKTLVQGIYYGSLLIIALYNLLIYLVLGERTYIYYVTYVLCITLFIACLDGWAFQYLWPTFTEWNDQAIIVSLACACAFGVAFSRHFLEIPALSRTMGHVQLLCIFLASLVAVAAFWLPYSLMIRILIPLAAAICIYVLITGIYAWIKGRAAARYYTLAWTLLLVGGVILALNKLNILPRNLFTDNATQLGSLLEVLLLSFALAERINQERSLRYAAQQQALIAQVRANEILEQRVNERTQALEEANRKLQELSNTDQLTGLKNRRYLDRFLEQEFARAIRYGQSLTVMLIDVDHFKAINDTHGHQVGDDCLREIAHRAGNQSRWPSDLVARYGGEEFCIVLPETSEEGGRTVAERVRQTIAASPVSTRLGPLSLTVSIGMYVGTPRDIADIAEFLAQADQALYQAKDAGRNRVVSLKQGPEQKPLDLAAAQ